jgi:Na+/H+ antiporter NhaD/arsenite permease-like protein
MRFVCSVVQFNVRLNLLFPLAEKTVAFRREFLSSLLSPRDNTSDGCSEERWSVIFLFAGLLLAVAVIAQALADEEGYADSIFRWSSNPLSRSVTHFLHGLREIGYMQEKTLP